MTQKLTRKEALELAQKIMTDAEDERAACAEAEARRTTDVGGHWPVVTGSAALSAAIGQIIVDEIGGIEASHPYMEGACAAIHARIIIELHERGVLEPPNK